MNIAHLIVRKINPANVPKETELKYAVSNASWDALLEADRVGAFALDAAEHREVLDVYSDTRDRAIGSAGFSFRIRTHAGERVACLKSLGRGKGIGHQREEYECAIGSIDSPDDWPEGETRDRFLQLTGGAPMVTEVEVHQNRITRALRSETGQVAELSLDEVRLHTGTKEHIFFELEIELLDSELHHVLHDLHQTLMSVYELEPVETSKYERAMRLVTSH